MINKIKRKLNKFFLKKNYSFLIKCLQLSLASARGNEKKGDESYYYFKNNIIHFLNGGKLPLKEFENSQYLKKRKKRILAAYFFQGILEPRQQLRYARMMLAINKDDNDENANIRKTFSEYIIRSYPDVIEEAKRKTKQNYLIILLFTLLYIISIFIIQILKFSN